MKSFFVSLSLILVLLCLVSCALPTETTSTVSINAFPPPEIDRTAEEIYLAHPEFTKVDYNSPALLPKSDDMGQEYIDRLTILCDSQHYWMTPFDLIERNKIWTGPEGTMTLTYFRDYEILDPNDNTRKTVCETVKEHQPEYLVIALGLNGIATSDTEGFIKDYTDLVKCVQEVSPDTKIICESILPIMPGYTDWKVINNEKITECNSYILKIAEEYGCRYYDSFSCIIGEDGNALPELMMDSLHCNKKGHSLILKYWRTHAWTQRTENVE